ncbi:MAG: hypothetical protein OXC28_04155 [Defluviicoccus sp.]|nr:hypothetical protein [Defluviicoccus sp.]
MSEDYDLELFMDESIRVSRENHYHPTDFIQMRERHGTAGAIRRLVRSAEIQSGLKRLVELGLSEWSVEAAVLRFPDEFSEQERQATRWRLHLAQETGGSKP